LLGRVGLDPAEKRQLRKFSKGMLQRVGIAQALLSDPDLFILDEPTGGLDPLGRRWVKELILELGQAGKTVFFSSHILGDAEAICDRVAFLHKGRLLAQGPMGEVLRQGIGGVDVSQKWEIQVFGEEVRNDTTVSGLTAVVEPLGPDTLLVPRDADGPEALLQALLRAGHRVRSVNRRQASLEDVFVRAMQEGDR
jgi:ABC-2 type transport system ATP-binding protein